MTRFMGLAAAALFLTGSAFAADLPSKKAPAVVPVAPVAFSWTGAYVGGDLGAVFGDSRRSFPGLPLPFYKLSGTAAAAGVFAGYNYQSGPYVFGAEAAVQKSWLHETAQCTVLVGTLCNTRQSVFGSVSGRIGYAFDRALVYATAGVAVAHYKSYLSVPLYFSFGSRNMIGGTVGLGADYAVSDHWIVGIDWKYYKFAPRKTNIIILDAKLHESENIVMARVAYKF